MIRFSPDKVSQQATIFVRNWIKLLSEGKLNEALSQIDEPNQYGIRWTALEFLKVMSEFCHGKKYQINNPDSLTGDGRASLVVFKDGSGYSFDYDLPLNGDWSDLTLQFEFRKRTQDYAIILHDIHTL